MALTLADLILRVGADTAEMKAGLADITKEARKTARDLESLGSGLASIGTGLTAAFTLPLAALGGAALKMSGDLEQAAVAFKTLLGSADAARVHLEQLKDFALKTPFQFPDLVQASKRLQALGFTASEVIPTLRAVGNAAAAMGTGAEGIQRITLALGQMQSKGRVQAEEMRQLAESGIPAWELLANAISKAEGKTVSIADTMKLVEKRMVDSSFGVSAIIAGINTRFAGLMEDQSKTLLGTFSNLKDRINFFLADVGDALAPLARKMLDSFTEVMGQVNVMVKRFTTELSPATQEWVIGFGAALAASGPIAVGLGMVARNLASVWSMVTKLVGSTSAVTVLGRSFVYLGLAIEGIKAIPELIRLADNLSRVFDTVSESATKFGATLKEKFDSAMAPVSEFFGSIGTAIAAFGTKLAESIPASTVESFQHLKEALINLIPEDVRARVDSFAERMKSLPSEIQSNWAFFSDFMKGLFLSDISTTFNTINRLIELFRDRSKEAAADAAKALDRINQANTAQMQPNVKNPFLLPNFAAEDIDKDRRTREAIDAKAKALAEAAAKAAAKFQTAVSQAFSAFGEEDTAGLAEKLTKDFNLLDRNDLFNNAEQRSRALAQVADAVAGITKEMAKARDEVIKLSKNLPTDTASWGLAKSTGGADDPEVKLKKMIAYVAEYRAKWETIPPAIKGLVVGLEAIIGTQQKIKDAFDKFDLADSMRKADDSIAHLAENWKATFKDITPVVSEVFKGIATDADNFNKQMLQDLKALGIADAQMRKKGVEEIIAANQRVQESDAYTAEQKTIANRTMWNTVIADTQRAANEAIGMDKLRLEQHLRMLEEQRLGETKFYTDLRDELRRVSDDLTTALSRAIFDWKNFGDNLKKIFEDLGASIIKNILNNLFHVQEQMNALTESLIKFLKGSFGGGIPAPAVKIPVPGGSAAGAGVSGAGAAAAEEGAIMGTGGGAGGAATGSGAGGALGSLGGLAGTVNLATGIANAVTGVLQYLQGRRMEQDIGRIEVTTRGMLNQLISIQGTLNDYLPNLGNFGPYFDSLKIAIGQLGETFTGRLGELYALIQSLGGLPTGGGGGTPTGETPTYNTPKYSLPQDSTPQPDLSDSTKDLGTALTDTSTAAQGAAQALSEDLTGAVASASEALTGSAIDLSKIKWRFFGSVAASNANPASGNTFPTGGAYAAANAPLGNPNAAKYVEPDALKWINSWDQVTGHLTSSLTALANNVGLQSEVVAMAVGPMLDLTQAIKDVVATDSGTVGAPVDPFAMIRNDAWVGIGSEQARYQQAVTQPAYYQGGDMGSLGATGSFGPKIGGDLVFNNYNTDPVQLSSLIGQKMEQLNITR